MSDYDVVIVGGGPAGSSTALHLVRKQGLRPERLLILDKAKFPRDKPCAGAVSQGGLDVLDALGVKLDVPSVPMRGVRVLLRGAGVGGSEAGETFAPMGVCVRRTELDHHLLSTARTDGVHVRDGEGITSLERTGGPAGGFRVNGGITTQFVAAADGAGSTTRKLLGLREAERKGHLYVLDTEPLAADARGIARGLVDFDLSVLDAGLEGYYWDFPTVIDGTAQVSRGIYHANFSPSDRVKEVLGSELARRGVDIAKVKLRPFSTRPFVPESIGALPGVLLVGEAFGIDRTTGEGIAQALEMGRIAAEYLARGTLAGYPMAVRRSTMGRHLLESAWLARRVYAPIGDAMRRYLLRSDYARTIATKWYRGERLARSEHARLGLGLGRELLNYRRR